MSPRNHKLHDAIGLALNYPTEWEIIRHDAINAKTWVRYLEGGWYEIGLDDSFIAACRAHTGPKEWVPQTNYEDIFNAII